jgi:hypothetical protein
MECARLAGRRDGVCRGVDGWEDPCRRGEAEPREAVLDDPREGAVERPRAGADVVERVKTFLRD